MEAIAMRGVGRCAWPALLVFASGGPLAAQDGKLDDLREAVRDEGGQDDEHEHEGWGDSLLDNGWFDGTFGDAFEFVLTLPFRGPRTGLVDTGFAPGRFQEYPGQLGPGYWIAPLDAPVGKRWSLRPRFEAGSDFDELDRTGIAVELEHQNRLGLDLAWSRFREDLRNGTDELDLADANLVYRFAQGPRAAFRAGLGLNYLGDAFGEDYGFNTTYAGTFLLSKRLSLGFEGDLGKLGDATLSHWRGSVGYVLERFEIYAAYDAWDVDSAHLDSFSLGLRAWL